MNEKTEGANLSLRSRDSPKKKKSLRSRLFSKKKKKKTNYLVCLLPNIYIYIYILLNISFFLSGNSVYHYI